LRTTAALVVPVPPKAPTVLAPAEVTMLAKPTS